MKREEKMTPSSETAETETRPNVVLGTTVMPHIYDKLVAYGKEYGLKDQEVVRIAIARLVCH
jgi:hypothetical protein